jgi:hypothetical protein
MITFTTQNSFVFFITTLLLLPLHAAEQKQPCEDNTALAITPLLKFCVLAEPHANYPGNGWNNGLGTDTIAALHCVSTLFNTLCTALFDTPRKKIVKQHKRHFAIKERSILFNKHGQWAGIGCEHKYPESWCIFFGNESSIHCIKKEYSKHDKSKTIPETLIDSGELAYHDEYGKKKNSAVFLIQNSCTYPGNSSLDNFMLIIPDEKQEFSVNFQINQEKDSYATYQKIRFYQELRKTTVHFLQRAFSLSEDPAFWSARYNDEVLSTEHNIGERNHLTLNLSNPFFKDSLFNSDALRTFLTNKDDCNCDTQYIDPACNKRYCNLLAIAQEENAYNLAKRVHTHFITHHRVHEIKDQAGSSFAPTCTLYTNAWNKLLVKKENNKPMETLILGTISCSGGGSWHAPSAEEKNTSRWQKMNDVIFYQYKGHENANLVFYATPAQKEIITSNYISNGNLLEMETGFLIQSAYQLTYGKDATSIVIFKIHSALENSYKLIYCMPFGCYDRDKKPTYTCNSLQALKTRFSVLMGKRADNGCKNRHEFTMKASEKDIDQMLLYLQTRNSDIASLTTEPEDTSTLLHFKKMSTVEYEFYRDKKIRFTPTHWIDKIWYGTSTCNIYSTQKPYALLFDTCTQFIPRLLGEPIAAIAGFILLSSIATSIGAAFCGYFSPLGILINSCVNCGVYDSKKDSITPTAHKIIWGSRIVSFVLFATFGRSLFSGIRPRIGCAMIPVLNLGLHAYIMNRIPETIELPFHYLYDSWPAQFRRRWNNWPENKQ